MMQSSAFSGLYWHSAKFFGQIHSWVAVQRCHVSGREKARRRHKENKVDTLQSCSSGQHGCANLAGVFRAGASAAQLYIKHKNGDQYPTKGTAAQKAIQAIYSKIDADAKKKITATVYNFCTADFIETGFMSRKRTLAEAKALARQIDSIDKTSPERVISCETNMIFYVNAKETNATIDVEQRTVFAPIGPDAKKGVRMRQDYVTRDEWVKVGNTWQMKTRKLDRSNKYPYKQLAPPPWIRSK